MADCSVTSFEVADCNSLFLDADMGKFVSIVLTCKVMSSTVDGMDDDFVVVESIMCLYRGGSRIFEGGGGPGADTGFFTSTPPWTLSA